MGTTSRRKQHTFSPFQLLFAGYDHMTPSLVPPSAISMLRERSACILFWSSETAMKHCFTEIVCFQSRWEQICFCCINRSFEELL